MALISCPECDGSVSSLAASCPHCGLPGAYLQSPELTALEPAEATVPSVKQPADMIEANSGLSSGPASTSLPPVLVTDGMTVTLRYLDFDEDETFHFEWRWSSDTKRTLVVDRGHVVRASKDLPPSWRSAPRQWPTLWSDTPLGVAIERKAAGAVVRYTSDSGRDLRVKILSVEPDDCS